jgi:hypothetical protein
MLTTGDELATAASNALGQELKFEDISECVRLFCDFTLPDKRR